MMEGYEIHMGETTIKDTADALRFHPLAHCQNGSHDGWTDGRRILGTYIHGILDNPPFIEMLLSPFESKIKERSKPFDIHAYT